MFVFAFLCATMFEDKYSSERTQKATQTGDIHERLSVVHVAGSRSVSLYAVNRDRVHRT